MAVAAVVWLSYEFWRLLWGSAPIWPTSPTGAVDLKLLHRLVHDWFAGRPVYQELASGVYPPATYVLLWPLLGWLKIDPARWLWGLTTIIALAALIVLLVRESGAEGPLERTFVALIPCSIYATGAAIGNGQLIVHILPLLLAGLLVLGREHRGWREDLIASALLVATMVKPPVSAPFLWLVLFLPRSWRPILLVGIGYALLTLFAVSFQDASLIELFRDWSARSTAAAVTGGYGNVANLHVWLGIWVWRDGSSLRRCWCGSRSASGSIATGTRISGFCWVSPRLQPASGPITGGTTTWCCCSRWWRSSGSSSVSLRMAAAGSWPVSCSVRRSS